MKHIVGACSLWLVLALCGAAHAQRQGVTEHDFLADMPVVLSVSRLAQRLDDTPGAVTILDRELIRRSGARDLVDVLRLVPGFQTTGSFETDATLASYHGRTDDWSNRIQVLVDGRSVYASHLQGSTGLGLHTLALDEIERVEVFRGSNSAAYGARAFLGVINIVSREGTEDRSGTAHAVLGENNVADAGVGLYGSTERSTYRLHADSRSDAGLRGAYGASRVDRFNLSSSMALGGGNELKLRAGALDIQAGRGSLDVDAYGNRARIRGMGSAFLQVDGRYVVDAHNDVQYSLSRTTNRFDDHFRYYGDASLPAYNGITIDFSG